MHRLQTEGPREPEAALKDTQNKEVKDHGKEVNKNETHRPAKISSVHGLQYP